MYKVLKGKKCTQTGRNRRRDHPTHTIADTMVGEAFTQAKVSHTPTLDSTVRKTVNDVYIFGWTICTSDTDIIKDISKVETVDVDASRNERR